MKSRAPRLCLEKSLFIEHQPKSPCEDLIELINTSLHASAPTMVMGNRSERSDMVTEFFTLSPYQQAMELANALLRQFAFRAYKARTPDIVPAFNNAFPRTMQSVTCKLFAQVLLDELGLTEEPYGANDNDDDDEMETARLSSTHIRLHSHQMGVENSMTFGSEREDTVLEQLARHAIRQFHSQHPGLYTCIQCDSPKLMSINRGKRSMEGSHNNQHTHFHKIRGSGKNFNAIVNCLNPITNSSLPTETKRKVTSALHKFFHKHPTEDEQVFAVASALLYQHVMNPYVLPLPTSMLWDVANEKDVDSSYGSLIQFSATNMSRLERSSHEVKKDDILKDSPEQRVLIDLLKCVQKDKMSWYTLSALFGISYSSACLTPYTQYADGMASETNSLRSSCSVSRSSFHQGDLAHMFTKSEAQDICDITVQERRRRFPSLLCLYLQSHLQKGLLSVESVNRRMMMMEKDFIQPTNWGASLREGSSTVPFSPYFSQGLASNSDSRLQSLHHSLSNIVSVRSMEGMTLIGRGSSGELFAMRRLDTGELVAVKRIFITEESRRHVEKEISVLKRSIGLTSVDDAVRDGQTVTDEVKTFHTQTTQSGIEEDDNDSDSEVYDHRAVVRCYDIFFDVGCAFIVMELMDSGSLMDALNARRGLAFSEKECCAITFQVLHGLRYLHDTLSQLHRDLKPHNILLDRRTGYVKLTDFGLSSNKLQSMGFNQCGTYVGTLAYMSPNRVDVDSVYGKESDFWSLGITLLQLALGKLPFTPNIFTIASFRTQPPRLSLTPIRNEKTNHEECNKHHFINSSTCVFSEAFQEFIALLLPAISEKECLTPVTSYINEEELSPLHECTFFELHNRAGSLGSDNNNNNNEIPVVVDSFKDDVVPSASIKFSSWPSSNSSLSIHKLNIRYEASSSSSPSSQPRERTNGNSNNKVISENNTLRGEYISTTGGTTAVELTATALLHHPWLQAMTWKESMSVISAISLETAATSHEEERSHTI